MSEVAYIGRMVKIDGKMYLEVGLGEGRERSAEEVPQSVAGETPELRQGLAAGKARNAILQPDHEGNDRDSGDSGAAKLAGDIQAGAELKLWRRR